MNKCTQPNGRHSWKFLDNFILQRSNGRGKSIRFTKKGRYRCEFCDMKKTGNPQ